MLRLALIFLIIAAVARISGFGGISLVASWLAKGFFILFLLFLVILLIAWWLTGHLIL